MVAVEPISVSTGSSGVFTNSASMNCDKEAQYAKKFESEPENQCDKIERLQSYISNVLKKHSHSIKKTCCIIGLILYAVYFGVVVAHDFHKALPLVICTIILSLGYVYYTVIKVRCEQCFTDRVWSPAAKFAEKIWSKSIVRWLFFGLVFLAFVVYLAVDTRNNRSRLIPLAGLAFYIISCFLFSTNPAKVKWRPVVWGLVLQFLIGMIVLRWPMGLKALQWFANLTVKFLNYSQEGTKFVYGFLAQPPPVCGMHPVFAFTVLQTLLFFGSVVALLYYFGIMQFVLYQMAWFMQVTLGTTAAESLNAAGCIFLGMTEAPLMIKPYFSKMTKSELHTVFASGFACIAGSLLVAYISFGACPVYLLSACVMSAPASIAVSKLLLPETEESNLKKTSDLYMPPSQERNMIEAISTGAAAVVDIIAQILANLVVFIAILAFVDNAVWWFADLVGLDLSFQKLLGYLFFPLAFIMGASDASDWGQRMNETFIVAQLMGTKTVINEFIAYKQMGTYVATGQISGRAQMMATFALCGFSNFASIGIQLGTIGSMCPEKKPVVAEIILRALVSGAVACFMTACVAGILVETPLLCHPELDSTDCLNVNRTTSVF